MKPYLFSLCIFCLLTSNCTVKKEPLLKSEQKKIWDSIALEKRNEVMKESREDLDRRRVIEVKPLVDSFLKKKEIAQDSLKQ